MTIHELADDFCVFTAKFLLVICIGIILSIVIPLIYNEAKLYIARTKRRRMYKRYCKRKAKADKAILNREVRWN